MRSLLQNSKNRFPRERGGPEGHENLDSRFRRNDVGGLLQEAMRTAKRALRSVREKRSMCKGVSEEQELSLERIEDPKELRRLLDMHRWVQELVLGGGFSTERS
jgi:hypothetical protein